MLFAEGGAAVLRGGRDHVFVDCGPVGLAGRGGHGHNDVTSVDAMLDGVALVLDPGTFTYTGSPEWRNRFRSTASHNAVQVDGEELNRLGAPHHLWSLRDDARPLAVSLAEEDGVHVLRVGHTGYRRLADPVEVARTVRLDPAAHRLLVADEVRAEREHTLTARLTLPPGASLEIGEQEAVVTVDARRFAVRWSGWSARAGSGWLSPSYGVKVEAPTLELTATRASGRLAFALGAEVDPGLAAWVEQA
jgi:hypothetical protein